MATLRPHLRAVGLHTAVVGALLVVSLVMWWHVWVTGDPSSSVTCRCGDTALNIWFVKWAEWSIAHLHNPLFTNAVFAGQGGANTLDTDVLAPGVVAAPVTALFGPIAAFNLLGLLVPVVNGWSMFFLLRKVVGYLPGDLLGSLYYAFAPDLVENMTFGHFNVDVAFFVPLALWCVHDLLIARRHPPARIGAALGALVAVQFFLGPEVLAMSALVTVLGGAFLLGRAPGLVWARRRELLQAAGVAGAIALVLLAYPAWFLLAGPRHTSGYPWPNTPADGTPLGNLVSAGAYGASSAPAVVGGYYGPVGPPYSYLGVALLALLAVSALVWWRRRLAQCLVTVGLLGAAFGLGTGALGRPSSTWLPWRIFDHVPVVMEILPMRFALFTEVAVSVLLAMSLRGWRDLLGRVRPRAVAGDRRIGVAAGGLLFAAGVATLAPIVLAEGLPFVVHPVATPAWITQAAPHLAGGTDVLVIPEATSATKVAMDWQAEDDFSFAMVDGYMLVPGADGRRPETVDPLPGAPTMLDHLSFFAIPPDASGTESAVMRAALARWGVGVVVVTGATPIASWDAGFFTAVLGRPPLFQDGSWVWYGLGSAPSMRLRPGRLRQCWGGSGEAPLAVPACVLRSVAGTSSAS